MDPNQDNPPAQSWRDSLKDESLKSSKSLEKFNDVESLGKSYVELEGKLGRSIELPKDEADQESWSRVYERLGRPKTAEEYELAAIEDPSFRKALAERGLKTGLNKRQLSEIAGAIKEREEASTKAIEAEAKSRYEQGTSKLKSKYGDKFDERTAQANKAFSKMFEGKSELFERLKKQGFDNDPDMVEAFADFYGVLAPDDNPIVGDKGGKQVSRDKSYDWMYEKYGGKPTPGRT